MERGGKERDGKGREVKEKTRQEIKRKELESSLFYSFDTYYDILLARELRYFHIDWFTAYHET